MQFVNGKKTTVKALTAAIFAALLLAAPAMAQFIPAYDYDEVFDIPDSEYATLDAAMTDINNVDNATVVINISQNQTASDTWLFNNGDGEGAYEILTLRSPSIDDILNKIDENASYDYSSYKHNHGANATLSPGAGFAGRLMTIENATEIYIGGLNYQNGALDGTVFDRGAGLHIDAVDRGDADNEGAGFNSAVLIFTTFEGNSVTQSGYTSGSNTALGGGLSVWNLVNDGEGGMQMTDSYLNLLGVNFINNTVSNDGSQSDGNTSSAIGGGARIAGVSGLFDDGYGIVFSGSSFTGNTAYGKQISHAHGGGLALEGSAYEAAIYNTTFSGNIAEINGASANGNPQSVARGGAIYAAESIAGESSIISVTGSTFENNQAKASGANTVAQGGAIALYGRNDTGTVNAHFSDTLFSGNSATAANDAGGAFGGAVYAGNGNVVMAANTSFLNNSATTMGGAIYVDLTYTPGTSVATTIMLAAGSYTDENDNLAYGKTVLKGNTADGQASGIHFYGDADTGSVSLVIMGDSATWLYDPVLVTMADNFALINMTRNDGDTAKGQLNWGGVNVWSVTDNGKYAYIGLDAGSQTNLLDDFSLVMADYGQGTGALALQYEDGAQLNIDLDRDSNTPIFDLSKVSSDSGALGESGIIGQGVLYVNHAFADRQLVDIEGKTITVAQFATGDTANAFVGGLGGNIVADEGLTWSDINGQTGAYVGAEGDVKVDVNFKSKYQDEILAQGGNTAGVINDLNTLVRDYDTEKGGFAIDDAAYEGIKNNWRAVTAEYGLTQALVAVNVTRSVANTARAFALPNNLAVTGEIHNVRPGNYKPYSVKDNYGFRAWAGYIGNFASMDSRNNYLGYKANTHGAAAGLNYDFGTNFTLGVFGAYTSTNTDLKNIKSEIDSDGYHGGIIAGFTPYELKGFGLAFDFTYSHYKNDGWRKADGVQKTKASFDQDLISVGLNIEYAFALSQNAAITPYLDMRYINLDQDGYTEKGLLANKVGSTDGNSFTTSLGARLDLNLNDSFKPYIGAAWRHEYGDRDFNAKAAYAGLDGSSFKLSSVETDRDSADVVAGFKLTSTNNRLGFNLGYNGNIGSHSNAHNIFAGFLFNF